MLRFSVLGALGFGAGAALALIGLATLPLVEPVSIPALTEDAATGIREQWNVRDDDLLAVTTEPRLAATEAATMKLRNSAGVVIGIASRLVGPQGEGRAALWTFVLGPRGTLAAELTQADLDGRGRLVGGTGEFQAVPGQFTETPHPEPGLRWRLELVRER